MTTTHNKQHLFASADQNICGTIDVRAELTMQRKYPDLSEVHILLWDPRIQDTHENFIYISRYPGHQYPRCTIDAQVIRVSYCCNSYRLKWQRAHRKFDQHDLDGVQKVHIGCVFLPLCCTHFGNDITQLRLCSSMNNVKHTQTHILKWKVITNKKKEILRDIFLEMHLTELRESFLIGQFNIRDAAWRRTSNICGLATKIGEWVWKRIKTYRTSNVPLLDGVAVECSNATCDNIKSTSVVSTFGDGTSQTLMGEVIFRKYIWVKDHAWGILGVTVSLNAIFTFSKVPHTYELISFQCSHYETWTVWKSSSSDGWRGTESFLTECCNMANRCSNITCCNIWVRVVLR